MNHVRARATVTLAGILAYGIAGWAIHSAALIGVAVGLAVLATGIRTARPARATRATTTVTAPIAHRYTAEELAAELDAVPAPARPTLGHLFGARP